MPPNEYDTQLVHSISIGQHQRLKIPLDYPNANPYDTKPGEKPYKLEVLWSHVFLFTYLHVGGLSAIFFFSPITCLQFLFGFMIGLISSFGVTAGAHRYWAHKCYKVTRPLSFILLLLQTISLQQCVITWVRIHRVHHKYSDTNADPHNANRGFFFSHIGWMLCKKHPDVIKYGKRVDISDLTSDPLLRFQKKYYYPLAVFFSLLLPTFFSMYIFDVTFWKAYHWHLFRFLGILHLTLTVNSVSHMWGNKPFEKNIKATDMSLIYPATAFGEGWHNYHHVFPFDYKCSESKPYRYNVTTLFIDIFAWLGWAYDLKTVSDEMVRRRVLRTGDGSHRYSKEEEEKMANELKEGEEERSTQNVDHISHHYWGWGDADIMQEDINDVERINPRNNGSN